METIMKESYQHTFFYTNKLHYPTTFNTFAVMKRRIRTYGGFFVAIRIKEAYYADKQS